MKIRCCQLSSLTAPPQSHLRSLTLIYQLIQIDRPQLLQSMAALVPTSPPSLTLTNRFVRLTSTTALRLAKPTATASQHRRPQWTCRKKDIHPEFHSDAKVYCNGELVMTTGGTQEDYNVDVWSGNHPFYLGKRTALLVDADQVEKFRKRFGEMAELMEIPVLKGEIVIPPRKKSASGKGGKKK